MKRRTIMPCWAVTLVAGGETHEVVQTGLCDVIKCEARIRRYFWNERGQQVDRFISFVRMNEKDAKAWLEADERSNAQ